MKTAHAAIVTAPRRQDGGGPGGPRPRGRPGGPAKRGKRNFVRKKKVCRFCVDKVDFIDYKKAEILAPFIQERGKILPRRMTGTCARHQRWLTVAIKRAQNIALLPFARNCSRQQRWRTKLREKRLKDIDTCRLFCRKTWKSSGTRGEVVEVAEGYARNFLLPRKLALEATPGNMKRLEKMRAASRRRKPRKRKRRRSWPNCSRPFRWNSRAKSGENDQLFGSVTSGDIAEALAAKGFNDRRSARSCWPSRSR